jgi:hypothetical protein
MDVGNDDAGRMEALPQACPVEIGPGWASGQGHDKGLFHYFDLERITQIQF